MRSPKVKKVSRRARTCKETDSTHYLHTSSPSPRRELLTSFNLSSSPNLLKSISNNQYSTLRNNHFHISSAEEVELSKLRMACLMYILITAARPNKMSECCSLRFFLSNVFQITVLPTKYVYLNVLDQNADCRETIVMYCLHSIVCLTLVKFVNI